MTCRLESYLESEPARKKAQQETQKAKLEALERKLGISGGNINPDAGPSTGQKRRFDDTEYIEKSQEIVDNVKNAVMAGVWSCGFPLIACLIICLRHFEKEEGKGKSGGGEKEENVNDAGRVTQVK